MKMIGVMGLGVMGKSIAINFASHNIKVVGYNRGYEQTEKLIKDHPEIVGVKSAKELVDRLDTPRHILLMVPAGEAVDRAVDELMPLLSKGDVIIDGGNSFFEDTHLREKKCRDKGIFFLGLGVSGGEEGALKGPSMMLGGDEKKAHELLPVLEKIAAQTPAPCIAYLGHGGAGHFVKMIHNGIEYAQMQSIAEIYYLLRNLYQLPHQKIVGLFKRLYQSDLSSYLLEITIDILEQEDDLGEGLLIEKISDVAKSKGTGRWTVEYALSQGISISTITAALDARILSSNLVLRKEMQNRFMTTKKAPPVEVNDLFDVISKLLFFSRMIIYTQGLTLLNKAKEEKGYSYSLPNILRIWRNGCIIRSSMLDQMAQALERADSLLLDFDIALKMEKTAETIRKEVVHATEKGIAIPVIVSALQYFEMIRSPKLPTDLIQAQRDYFGAHTYERIDREGIFHTKWEKKC